MIKEQVLDALSALGFIPEFVNEAIGYKFEYDGLVVLYRPEREEATCVNLTVPGIFDITEANRSATLEALMKLTDRMMYIQPNIIMDQVWLTYQHYVGENPINDNLLEHMILVVVGSTNTFRQIIAENNIPNE